MSASSREDVLATVTAERQRIERMFAGDRRAAAVEQLVGPSVRLVAALDGVELSAEEWGMVGPSGEAETAGRLASVIEKARRAGPAGTP